MIPLWGNIEVPAELKDMLPPELCWLVLLVCRLGDVLELDEVPVRSVFGGYKPPPVDWPGTDRGPAGG